VIRKKVSKKSKAEKMPLSRKQIVFLLMTIIFFGMAYVLPVLGYSFEGQIKDTINLSQKIAGRFIKDVAKDVSGKFLLLTSDDEKNKSQRG